MTRSEIDYYMKLAIELAEKGRGTTSPNPMVGALIVKNGEIIGKGYHRKAGEAHAEVNALNEAGSKSMDSTLVCTLEPCSHFGRTPPCTSRIIESGVKNVFIGAIDPNPIVSGKGVELLKEANIVVGTGFKEKEIREQNEAFFKLAKTGFPHVTLKTAISADRKISGSRERKTKITGREAQEYVHNLRSQSDAVLTGIGTVLCDDPLLNVRYDEGRNPSRIIVDTTARIPMDSNIVKTAKEIRTVIFVGETADRIKIDEFIKKGVEVRAVETGSNGLNMNKILSESGKMGFLSILVEAGAKINATFVSEGLIDRLIIIEADKMLGQDAVDVLEGNNPDDILKYFKGKEYKQLGADKLYDTRLRTY